MMGDSGQSALVTNLLNTGQKESALPITDCGRRAQVRASLISCALSVVQLHGFASNFSRNASPFGVPTNQRMAATALEGTARKTRSRKCARPGNSESVALFP